MRFIVDFFNGDKKLLKSTDCTLTEAPPKIEKLCLKDLWSKYANDKILKSYWPIYSEKQMPNREYFFKVLGTIYPDKLNGHLEEADQEKLQKLKENNNTVRVKSSIFSKFKKASKKFKFMKTKRIMKFGFYQD